MMIKNKKEDKKDPGRFNVLLILQCLQRKILKVCSATFQYIYSLHSSLVNAWDKQRRT